MVSAVATGDTTYAVSVVWPIRGPSQFHGGSVSSWWLFVRPETIRPSTSVSHASGSTLLSFAVWISVLTIAQCRPPLSEGGS